MRSFNPHPATFPRCSTSPTHKFPSGIFESPKIFKSQPNAPTFCPRQASQRHISLPPQVSHVLPGPHPNAPRLLPGSPPASPGLFLANPAGSPTQSPAFLPAPDPPQSPRPRPPLPRPQRPRPTVNGRPACALTLVHQPQSVREGGVQGVLLRHQLRQVLLLHARWPPGPGRRHAAGEQRRPRNPRPRPRPRGAQRGPGAAAGARRSQARRSARRRRHGASVGRTAPVPGGDRRLPRAGGRCSGTRPLQLRGGSSRSGRGPARSGGPSGRAGGELGEPEAVPGEPRQPAPAPSSAATRTPRAAPRSPNRRAERRPAAPPPRPPRLRLRAAPAPPLAAPAAPRPAPAARPAPPRPARRLGGPPPAAPPSSGKGVPAPPARGALGSSSGGAGESCCRVTALADAEAGKLRPGEVGRLAQGHRASVPGRGDRGLAGRAVRAGSPGSPWRALGSGNRASRPLFIRLSGLP